MAENVIWIGFSLFVVAMLILDLGVFHRKAHVVPAREAAAWVAVWVALALAFGLFIYYWRGPEAGLQFLMGYLLEESLSVDNMFIFILLFSFFQVRPEHQHQVLFWGIVGALAMRLLFIVAGASLLHRFHWVIYVFGAFLVFTGLRMGVARGEEVHPERNPVLRFARRFLPVSGGYDGPRFFTREDGRLKVTPLLLVLLIVESTDVVFAVDSIPAIFGVTDDPLIIYTSNVFAVMGLRSLYFLLAGIMGRVRYLKQGLAVVLGFIGAKMLLADVIEIPVLVSLGVIVLAVGGAVLASVLAERRASAGGGGHRREDLGAGPGNRQHVLEVDGTKRRLPGHQHQGVSLFEGQSAALTIRSAASWDDPPRESMEHVRAARKAGQAAEEGGTAAGTQGDRLA